MDSEELIHRCEAISLKSEEDDMIDFAGKNESQRRENSSTLSYWKNLSYTWGLSGRSESGKYVGKYFHF